jgi:hypothetical protein
VTAGWRGALAKSRNSECRKEYILCMAKTAGDQRQGKESMTSRLRFGGVAPDYRRQPGEVEDCRPEELGSSPLYVRGLFGRQGLGDIIVNEDSGDNSQFLQEYCDAVRCNRCLVRRGKWRSYRAGLFSQPLLQLMLYGVDSLCCCIVD